MKKTLVTITLASLLTLTAQAALIGEDLISLGSSGIGPLDRDSSAEFVQLSNEIMFNGTASLGDTFFNENAFGPVNWTSSNGLYIRSTITTNPNIGFTVSNKARIFKVIKTPVLIEQHPEKISGVLGYEFYNTDPGTGRVKELSQSFGNEAERLYWEKLDDLAHDISSFLESLEHSKSFTGTLPDIASTNGQVSQKVFLAESSSDTQDFRDSLKRELQGYGYHILPDKQLPLISTALNESLISNLNETVLTIHLLGENYGVIKTHEIGKPVFW
jgi:hypothetical protein